MRVDLRPAVLDLALYAGDATAVTLRFWTDAAKTTPADVSDREWSASWREDRTSDPATELELDDSEAATGVVIVRFSAADTSSFAEVGVWDVQGAVPGSDPSTLVTGYVTVQRDVTRDEVS